MSKFVFTEPTSFDSANAILGDNDVIVISLNTYLKRFDEKRIDVVYYGTPIVSYRVGTKLSGNIILVNNGGYRNVSTTRRINAFTPPKVNVATQSGKSVVTVSNGDDITKTKFTESFVYFPKDSSVIADAYI